jgi:hypothetical protein
MDLKRVIAKLHSELEEIDIAIRALSRLESSTQPGRVPSDVRRSKALQPSPRTAASGE